MPLDDPEWLRTFQSTNSGTIRIPVLATGIPAVPEQRPTEPAPEPETLLPKIGEVDNSWRQDRVFQVTAELVLSGWKFVPNRSYKAISFGRAQDIQTGATIALTTDDKTELLNWIQWKDTPSRITPSLLHLIKKNPTSPYVRGFVRDEIGIAPAKKDTPTTTEGWIEFINAQPLTIPKPSLKTQLAAAITAEQEARAVEPTIRVRISAQKGVTGHSYWTRLDTCEQTIEIPESVILEGREAAVDWIYENCDDLPWDAGGEEYTDSGIDEDHGMELLDHNISSVIRRYEAGHPGVEIPD